MRRQYWTISTKHPAGAKLLCVDGPSLHEPTRLLIDHGEIELINAQEMVRRGTFWLSDDAVNSDFVAGMVSRFLCKEQVFEEIASAFGDQLLALDVKVGDEVFKLIRTKEFLDILDWERTKYRLLPSGTPTGFKEFLVTAPPPADIDIFSLDGPPTLRSFIFCSVKFKRFIEKNDYSGMKFSPGFEID